MGFERKREELSLPIAHMSTLGINLYRDTEGSQENVLTISYSGLFLPCSNSS